MIGDRWGVSREETARRYPCDDIVPAPVLQVWRGVTIEATPDEVWAWVCQIRLGPYAYDWIDNLGRRSPQELHNMPDPVPGQHFTTALGRQRGRILAVDPTNHLTGRIMGAVISYVLVPTEKGTRLLLKIVVARYRFLGPFLSLGDLVMARRQLLNLKRLAERREVGRDTDR